MNNSNAEAKIDSLLMSKYGLSITDFDSTIITRDLEDGEEPESIVDFLAEKYNLVEIGKNKQNPGLN